MIQKPRGTQDYFKDEFIKRRAIENKFVEVFSQKGYFGLETPIFEQQNLFVRTVGEQTDIVQKEMFNLEKKSDETYTLRPEFTAGVIRSLIEMGIKSMPLPVKVFSVGPCFRYEKPQKGRKRQFNQLNIELVGKKSPEIDAELILDGYEFLESIGLKNIEISLNSLGNQESKEKYSASIKEFFATNKSGLCELCQIRADKNPLRVLDCKNEECKKIVKELPTTIGSLSKEEKNYLDKVIEILKTKNASVKVETTLVRGLDYYTGVIFEYIERGDEQRMNSLGGGGRYDGMVKELDGPDLPAIGMALGFERIVNQEEGSERAAGANQP
jgi:histidyl-tRNA synthetase